MSKPGQRIKKFRTLNNLDTQVLAEELGYKTAAPIHRWEANESLPNGRDLKKLGQLFEISADYILGLDEWCQ